MLPKVKVRNTETGEVHEVFSVDAAEMLAQEDGLYEPHTGGTRRKKKGASVDAADAPKEGE